MTRRTWTDEEIGKLRDMRLAGELIRVIVALPRQSTEIAVPSGWHSKTISEQIEAMRDACSDLIGMLNQRQDPALRRLMRDALEPEELHQLFRYLLKFRNGFEPKKSGTDAIAIWRAKVLLKNYGKEIKHPRKSPRTNAQEHYALRLAGCFLAHGVKPTTTKNGKYVRVLMLALGTSNSTAGSLAVKAISRANALHSDK